MKTIAIWFSCGAASAVAAKKTIEKYGNDYKILIVNNPVKEEHIDNIRFKQDVSKWLNHPIIDAKSEKYPNCSIVEVFDDRKLMSMIKYAPCTEQLKKQARYEFELKYNIDFHVLGYTLEEKNRNDRFIKYERENILSVLIDEKITKPQCFDILDSEGLKLPEIYKLGFPNANCIGCVKATSPTYWNLVRKKFPDIFQQRCEQSRRLNCRLVELHKKRIYLDELKITDKGGKIKSWECGIFCISN